MVKPKKPPDLIYVDFPRRVKRLGLPEREVEAEAAPETPEPEAPEAPREMRPRVGAANRTVLCVDVGTISIATGDVLTIQIDYQTGQFSILNYGPGNIWINFDPLTDPVVGAESCMLLNVGVSKFFEGQRPGPTLSVMKLTADAYTTVTFAKF